VSTVHGNAGNDTHEIELRPGKFAREFLGRLWFARVHLDKQHAPAFMGNHGASTHRRIVHHPALHRERPENAACIRDSRAATSEQPKPSLFVQPSCVSGAMPRHAVHAKFRFVIAAAIQIAG
jgi:hypothetical protein